MYLEAPKIGDKILETDKQQTAFINTLLDVFYPVGVIFETTSTISPAETMGGTWERYGNGRVTVGLDSTQTEFDTVGKIGGANTHSLTADENGPHTHKYGTSTKSNLAGSGSDHGTAANTRDYETSSSGTGKPHNNLQPYIVVYRWRRIA